MNAVRSVVNVRRIAVRILTLRDEGRFGSVDCASSEAHPTTSPGIRAKRLRRTDGLWKAGMEIWWNSAVASFLICLICLCVFWPATRPSAALPRVRLIFFVNT